jgi:hypothetical protein
VNFPIVNIPEYYFFIGTPVSLLIGFLMSLTPYCFAYKLQRLWSIPITIVPAIIIVLITPETIFSIMTYCYIFGFLLGSIVFYLMYKQATKKQTLYRIN